MGQFCEVRIYKTVSIHNKTCITNKRLQQMNPGKVLGAIVGCHRVCEREDE